MRLDAELEQALGILVGVLERRGIDSCIVGARVLQILFPEHNRATEDVDFVILVSTWSQFDAVVAELLRNGFAKGRLSHELCFGDSARVDIIPFHPDLSPGGVLRWRGTGEEMNVAGYTQLFETAEPIEIVRDVRFKVCSFAMFVLMKIVCYYDRRERGIYKDLGDLASCFELSAQLLDPWEHLDAIPSDDTDVDSDTAGSFLLGKECQSLLSSLDPRSQSLLQEFLAAFGNSEQPEIDIALRESGHRLIEERDRVMFARQVRAFGKGIQQ